MDHPSELILASTSQARRRMLERAGLHVRCEAPKLDEDAQRRANDHLDARAMAQFLADAKAASMKMPGAMVIAADQTLECQGKLFSKPQSLAEARAHLEALRGKTHQLHAAVSCSRNGVILFRHTETASLTMRQFSDAFLDTYLNRHGAEIQHAVGCYFYEAEGIQLFERVDGDYYAILGLPLLPLLAFLRRQAMVPS